MLRADAGEDVRADVLSPGASSKPGGTAQANSSFPSLAPRSMYWRIFAAAAASITGPNVRARLQRVADDQPARRFDQPREKGVVGGGDDDRAAARGALLPAVAEGRLANGDDGLVEVGGFVER